MYSPTFSTSKFLYDYELPLVSPKETTHVFVNRGTKYIWPGLHLISGFDCWFVLNDKFTNCAKVKFLSL